MSHGVLLKQTVRTIRRTLSDVEVGSRERQVERATQDIIAMLKTRAEETRHFGQAMRDMRRDVRLLQRQIASGQIREQVEVMTVLVGSEVREIDSQRGVVLRKRPATEAELQPTLPITSTEPERPADQPAPCDAERVEGLLGAGTAVSFGSSKRMLRGAVCCVVPANTMPLAALEAYGADPARFRLRFRAVHRGDETIQRTRPEPSYLCVMEADLGEHKPRLYWPTTSTVRVADHQGALCD